MMQLNFLLASTFRANPNYILAESGTLNRPEQEALAGLLTDPEAFGVFKPKDATGTATCKLAYKEIALLFYFLQQPGRLPYYLKNNFDDDINNTLAKLVLEDILEIEYAGQFVSGAAAQDALYKTVVNLQATSDLGMAKHSFDAIHYALQLNLPDSRSIATRLYCYNTVPLMQPNDVFDAHTGVEHFLGIQKDDPLAWEILKHWNKHEATDKYKWLAWSRKGSNHQHSSEHITYKIYISPVLAEFPQVFEKSVRVLTRSKAFSFKTGMDRHGVLRPDKFVVYFYSYDDLAHAAEMLKEALKDFDAQGVPFTGQLDDKGMLSWGIDPAGKDVLENFEGSSWRAGVTEKIAAAIMQAKSARLNHDKATRYIINRISLEGIDPVNWVPAQQSRTKRSLTHTIEQ